MKRMRPRLKRNGFTLIEVLVVVMVIGILAAIAVGVYTKARENSRRWSCIANMKAIDGAKMQWALENNKSPTDAPTEEEVLSYMINDKMPRCPSGGGVYEITPVDERTVCPNVDEFPNHVQP
jgi:prepilin-type N-terminal cleavage/methylation domain-containing protein